MNKYCLVCNKKLVGSICWLKRAKYCSHHCSAKGTRNGFKKGKFNPEWKGGKPYCIDCGKEVWWGVTRCRSCASRGENSAVWRGDGVSYNALHAWIRSRLGVPKKCDCCGSIDAKRYDWSNISYKYKRDINDWERLCRSCHMKKDKNGLHFGAGKDRKFPQELGVMPL